MQNAPEAHSYAAHRFSRVAFDRKPDVVQLAVPGTFPAIDGLPLGLRQRYKRIALRRMQPAAAQVDRHALDELHFGRVLQARQRLDQQD